MAIALVLRGPWVGRHGQFLAERSERGRKLCWHRLRLCQLLYGSPRRLDQLLDIRLPAITTG